STTGDQGNPAIASNGSGDFVVVWQSSVSGPGGTTSHVFGQRFHAFAKAGSEFQISLDTSTNQVAPTVGMDAAGNFVVAWDSAGSGFQYGIDGQRFDATGAPSGAAFPIAAFGVSSPARPRLAMRSSGEFVVVWFDETDGSAASVVGQRFDASAGKLGTLFPINSYTTGNQRAPVIGMDAAGNFVVAWQDDSEEGSETGIFAQRFNSGAEKVGAEFQVNTFTTNAQQTPSIAVLPSGRFLVTWTSQDQDGSQSGVFGQRFDRAGRPVGGEFPINTYTSLRQQSSFAASDGDGFVVTWDGYFEDGSPFSIFGRRENLRPATLAVDVHGIGTSDLNGVAEPGEAVVVEPAWENTGLFTVDLTGVAQSLGGPPGPTYQLLDGAASYGSMPPELLADCNDGNPSPCYALQVSGSRPATHWDATFEEVLSTGGIQIWTIHLGDSFTDVPRSEPFYKKIETLLHNGITAGCDMTEYCPSAVVNREAMAIFIAKGIAGLGELVPSAGKVGGSAYDCSPGGHSLFNDVTPTDAFCKHVHFLAAQNVTLGCNAAQYCPAQTITRDAMASFIAKAIVAPGGGNAVPVSYTDATTSRSYSCVSGSANLHFTDVPVSNAFCKHIHYLWAKGIVDGCTPTTYCPSSPVARDAMAKFIANGFGLTLYGP
ncbi:MAG TPA: hypothetical protein VIA45_05325, partial [Thermoanaerobaculia bacterium]